MYYYGYRFYSPGMQRWINRDPIEEAGALNLYEFGSNNPLRAVDGDGRGIILIPIPGSPFPAPVQFPPGKPTQPPSPVPTPPPGPAKCPVKPPSQWPTTGCAAKWFKGIDHDISLPGASDVLAEMLLGAARKECLKSCKEMYSPGFSTTGYTPAQDKACLDDCNSDCDKNYKANKR
jgi:hypothetical protein